jgi:hypothetical protein
LERLRLACCARVTPTKRRRRGAIGGLAFAGVSQAEDLKRLEAVQARANDEGFAPTWLRERQLDWAADLIHAEQDRRVEDRSASTEALA